MRILLLYSIGIYALVPAAAHVVYRLPIGRRVRKYVGIICARGPRLSDRNRVFCPSIIYLFFIPTILL